MFQSPKTIIWIKFVVSLTSTASFEQTIKPERKPLDEVVDNIVLVMDESFYDPEILGKHYAHTGGDVVPNLHKAIPKVPKWVYVFSRIWRQYC